MYLYRFCLDYIKGKCDFSLIYIYIYKLHIIVVLKSLKIF